MARTLSRGRLNTSVKIQSKTTTRNVHGGVSKPTWATVATVWAEVKPLGGSEGVTANALTSDMTHLVTLDYYAALTSENRFLIGSRILNISAVIDVDNRHIVHECECKEFTK